MQPLVPPHLPSLNLLSLHGHGLGSEAIAVAEEQNTLASALGFGAGLNPLAPTGTLPECADEAPRTVLGVGAVVLAHDGLDGLGSLVGLVEGDAADVVVEDVSLNNAVEQVSADEAHLTVNGGCGAANKVPLVGGVVRQGRIGVLEEGDGD